MNIKVDFKEFKKALKILEKVKTTDTINGINDIHIIAGDNNIICTKNNLLSVLKVNINAYIEELGQVIIPASTIKLINNIKKPGQLQITDEYIKFNSKIINFKKIPISNFPESNLNSDVLAFKISEKELNRMLEVQYAVATDETRPILTGINIYNNKFCAIDGYRASIRESDDFKSDLNVTFSKDLLKVLNSVIDKKSNEIINVYVDSLKSENDKNKYIRFQFKNYEIESKLLEGNYIKYESIIPDIDNAKTILQISDNEIMDKLGLINKLEYEKYPIVVFDIKEDEIIFTGSDLENTMKDEIIGVINGESLKIGFNNNYFIDGIKQYSKEKFNIYCNGNLNPIIITNDYKNLELVLPVRMKD